MSIMHYFAENNGFRLMNNQKMKMLEDLIYEAMPVVGFLIFISSIFVIFSLKKLGKTAPASFRFFLFFAVSDFLTGIGVLIDGFYGIIITIYGNSFEKINASTCFLRAFHIPIFIFTDYLHILILCLFTLDRFIQILMPILYGKICSKLLNWKLFAAFLIVCGSFTIRAFIGVFVKSQTTETVGILPHCRFDDVVGEEFYEHHMLIVKWSPIICIGFLSLTLLIYAVRMTNHRWCYNWPEASAFTKQLIFLVFVRCALTGLSIHLPLIIISKSSESHESRILKDNIIRLSYWITVIIIQPIWYFILIPSFLSSVSTMFNKYSENTERKWQSATDPPIDTNANDRGVQHLDRHGDVNPFGSWYSMTGNVTGEAGIPVGNERSISFYYDKN